MNDFKAIDTLKMDEEFLVYLDDFVGYMVNDVGVNRMPILDMIYHPSCTYGSMSDFFENAERIHNRTLLAIILNEFDAEYGLSRNHAKSQKIYDVFSTTDYCYINIGGDFTIDEALEGTGISGVYNSFSTRDSEISKKLTMSLYPVIRHEERIYLEPPYPAYELCSKLLIAARSMSISKTHGYSELSQVIRLPVELQLMASIDFFSVDKADQKIIIEEAIQFFSDTDDKKTRRPLTTNDYKILAAKWPAEFIRSRIIAGDDPVDLCQKASSVIEILLEKSMVNSAEIKTISENIKKSALFPFADEFKKVFGEDLLPIHLAVNSACSNSSCNNSTGSENTSFPYWIGMDLSNESVSCSAIAKTIDSFYDYGYDDLSDFSSIIKDRMSDYYFSIEVCVRALKDRPDDYIEFFERYIDRSKGTKERPTVESLKNAYLSILGRNIDEVSSIYNNHVLNAFAKDDPVSLKGLRLNTSNQRLRDEAIDKIAIDSIKISRELISSGKFTPSDFHNHWANVDSKSKREFLNNTLGM